MQKSASQKSSHNKCVLALMNAYTQGKSGGDVCFIEIFKRIKSFNTAVITSLQGKKLCRGMGLRSKFYITSKEKHIGLLIPTYMLRIMKALWLITQLQTSQIIYATSDSLPDTVPSFLFKFIHKGKTKWIQKIFHIIPKDRKISYYSQKISFFLIKKLADIIILDNEILKEELVSIGFPKEKLKVNHLGIDLKYFNSIKPANISYEAVFMARLHPSKGIFDLVDIWKEVIQKIPHAQLAIIGKGEVSFAKRLQKQIVKNKLQNNIHVLGYLADRKAFSLIKAAQLFISPSHEEGFGLTIAEAMATGTSVVAYDLPAFQNTFKPGITTIIPFHTDEFASKIVALLHSNQQLIPLKKKGQELIKSFDLSKTVKRELQYING